MTTLQFIALLIEGSTGHESIWLGFFLIGGIGLFALLQYIRPHPMISKPRTGKPSVARFVLGALFLGAYVAYELETGEFIGRGGPGITRAHDPAMYWTGISLEISILLGMTGYFLYRSMTQR